MSEQGIAIVGMGCMLPEAGSLAEAWRNIESGKDCIRDIPLTHWRPEDYFDPNPRAPDMTYAKRGGFLRPYKFNPVEWGITPNAVEATDTSQILGMVVAHHALEDAGMGPGKSFDKSRVSVIMGVTGTLGLVVPLGQRLGHPQWRKALKEAGVDDTTAAEVIERIKAGFVGWQSASFPGLLGNVVAGRIANKFDLGGTNCVVDAACASSLAAVHLAMLELEAGRSDAVVTGGVDTFNDIFMFMCFSKTPALSPSGDAKPFDKNADGTTLGEGVGAFVMKRLSDARRDGDRIYAVIKSIGTSSDGYGQAIYAPAAKGQVVALRRAYAAAGVSPTTIGLVEAHGTGTKVGDAVEVKALTEVFREAKADGDWCSVGTIKAQIGHTKAAAGVAGMIKAAMALHRKVLPPSIKVKEPAEGLAASPFRVETRARPWIGQPSHPRRAGVSAFGFGGSNFHCVLEEAPKDLARAPYGLHDGAAILAYSAGSTSELASAAAADLEALAKLTKEDVGAGVTLMRTLGKQRRGGFDAKAAHRLAVVLEVAALDAEALTALAEKLQRRLTTAGGADAWAEGRAAFYDSRAFTGGVAAIFPGQGAQYPGMLQGLACRSPEILSEVEAADRAYAREHGPELELAESLFPPPAWTDDDKAAQRARLTATQKAQPAIGAVSLGALRALEGLGFQFDAAAGHSFGELTALCAAGWLDAADFHALAVKRGALMEGRGEDRGGMLAVAGTREDIETQARASGLEVVLANHNAPRQSVLAGPKHEIARAAAAFLAAGIGAKQLDVSAGFHSPLVADAAEPFAEALGRVELRPQPARAVYANRAATPYPMDTKKARALLAEQIASPVEFVAMVRRMHADGIRAFVEIGPGKRLGGLVRTILENEAVDVLALDDAGESGGGLGELARLAARLAVRGLAIDLTRWDADYEPAPETAKPSFTIAISGANHFVPKAARLPKAKKQKEGDSKVATTTPSVNGHAGATVKAAMTAPAPVTPPSAVVAQAAPVRPAQQTLPAATPAPLAQALTATPAASPAAAQAMQHFAPQPAPAQAMQLFAPQPVAASFMQHAILSLQRMQEQNADLHRQFLQNQMASQAMLFGLLGNPTAAGYAPAPAAFASSAYTAQPAAFAPMAPTLQPASFAPPAHTAQAAAFAPPAPQPAAYASQAFVSPVSAPQPAAYASQAFVSPVSAPQPAAYASQQAFTPPVPAPQPAAFAPAAPAPQPTAFAASAPQAALPHVQEATTTRAGAYVNGSAGAPRPAAGAAPDLIRETLLAIVSEKTGYPVDMVDPSMSLEGDLGIDSIKRVEILAELQARLPAAGSVKPEELTKLATLNEIITKLAAGAPAQVATKAASPVVTTAAQAPAAAPAAAASGGKAEIAAALVDIVAEKTGYPPDMVGLDMQIEGDLGIDSIKRVEILSALQEKVPATKAAPADLLSRCKTLAEIAETAASAAVQKKNLATASEPPASPASERSSASPALELDLYAVEMAAAPAPGAIFLTPTPERRSFVVAAADPADDLARAFAKSLEGRGFSARLVALASAAQESTGLVAGLAILAPRGETAATHKTRAFLLNALRATRAHAAALRGAAQPTRLMSVSFAGGRFAHGGAPSADAARHAAVAGLIKTAGHEWPDVQTLAVDADPTLAVDELAAQLADEALRFGPAELGLTTGERLSPRLAKAALPAASAGASLQEGGLVVVSGGARGVTAQSILALARMRRHAFLVLGRSPMPAPEPAWLESLTEPLAIKRALVANTAGKLSPRELQAACDAVLNAREMRATLAGLAAAGCPAHYRAVDTRDGEALCAAVAEAVAAHGPVRGVVHGAGVLADRLIDAQTDEQFLTVYDTKVQGLDALLAAVDPVQLGFVALFSSTTARLGRKGQGAYAVANEALNKAAQVLAATHPDMRVVSLGWGPWAGGMVSPGLAKLFAEEGIALVGLDAGAQLFARTLTADGQAPVEQVVVGAGTRLVEKAPETSVTPSVTPSAAHADETAAFGIEASVAGIPVLRAHVLGGRAVVPAALLMEWMALAAVHLNPGLEVVGLDRFRVLKGVVLDATDTRRLRVAAQRLQLDADGYGVSVSIVSERADGHVVRHAAAEVRLADLRSGAPAPQLPRIVEAAGTDPERVYLEDLFHGPAMQGIESVLGRSESGVSALVKAAPAPATWWSAAPRAAWLTEPLAVDVAFQLMVLWTKAVHGAPSLPSAVRRYRQFQRQFPAEGCEARLCVTEHSAHKAVGDIEFLSADGTLVARLEGYEATIDQSLARAFARRALEEAQG